MQYRDEFFRSPYAPFHDDTGSCAIAGMCYMTGTTQEQNYKQAATLFRLAATQGHVDAMYQLAILHFTGQGVHKLDEVQAAQWFSKAAQVCTIDETYRLATRCIDSKFRIL